MDEVAMIAVVNNPDLKATRDQVGVAEAQAFAAGLLPNPQFSFAYGGLISGVGATTSSVSATLTQDIVPLSNRRIRTRTYGGVGGAEPRGSPLSRSLARQRRDAGRQPSGRHHGCSGHTSAQPVHASSQMSYTQSTFVY
jgi:hypothetical protein